MDEDYRIETLDEPAWSVIGGGIRDYNTQQTGDGKSQLLCVVLRAPDDEIVGGLIGETYWGWLHVDLLWLREDLRGRGFGQRLLAAAEDDARQRGAKHAYLDTFSFQAPEFYRRLGYRVFGELPDFPSGHQRYFMCKDL